MPAIATEAGGKPAQEEVESEMDGEEAGDQGQRPGGVSRLATRAGVKPAGIEDRACDKAGREGRIRRSI